MKISGRIGIESHTYTPRSSEIFYMIQYQSFLSNPLMPNYPKLIPQKKKEAFIFNVQLLMQVEQTHVGF